jgi:uncharacterized protein with ParB-like and HNH nuclease domain
MKTISETIRKIVGYLNNPEHAGGIWLLNIQRNFVRNEEQMTRLFDSILREYPRALSRHVGLARFAYFSDSSSRR